MSPFRVPAEDDPTRPRAAGDLRVTVDGEPLTAVPGQTIAAALMASGRDSWRRTRFGDRPRGVFCGIGACFDCLVTVNDVPDTRACQRTIAAGDTITTDTHALHSSVRIRPSDPAPGIRQPTGRGGFGPMNAISGHVVVVGAGPAGIAAALAAADAGVPVLLVDAGPAVGGQYHRQLPDDFRAERPEAIQHGWSSFTRQRERIQQHDLITHLADTSVWAIEPVETGQRLHLQTGPADASGRELTVVETSALVLATGAYDRALPFPGWDLPGVYTAGAAQALAKGQRVAVGKRVLLAGTGPFLLPVAESLLGVGARPVALLEANSLATVTRGWLRNPLVARGKLGEGARYAAMLARHRIPVHHGQTVVAAHGTDRVEAVTVARLDSEWQVVPGSERRVEVDAVCVGFGFTPNLELAVTAGCALDPFVVVDDDQCTSIPGVFAAGEITGIAGAVPSAAEGRVAGAGAASSVLAARGHKGPMNADTPGQKGPMNGIHGVSAARAGVGRVG